MTAILVAFAIDLATQHVVALSDLPDHAPRRRRGKKLHKSTPFRWAKDGARDRDGVVWHLPTIQVAGTKCTSLEAFQWFCERLSAGTGNVPAGPRTTAARRKAIE